MCYVSYEQDHLYTITVYIFIFFFFSSRRRHTRFDCDWSSDVCSSDLDFPAPSAPLDTGRQPGNPPHTEHCAFGNAPAAAPAMETSRILPIAVAAADPILVLSEPLHLNVGLVRVQQPRGPPRFA